MAHPTPPGTVALGDYGTETWADRTDAYLKYVGINRPRCLLYRDAGVGDDKGFGVSHATTTLLTFSSTDGPGGTTSEVEDTDGFHSTASNTSRITIPSGLGGTYLFHAAVSSDDTWSAGPAWLNLEMYVNGVTAYCYTRMPTTPSTGQGVEVTRTLKVNAGDYFEVAILHVDGSTRYINRCWFEAILMGWT